ncbi:Uncharacterised protein [Mycobacterium tuberculosis]|uniref:Uncharacterized protein n=1 Tax=Mycobacterium tuberculosis TaxID=1773 RepID=A0A0T9B513_MYCTX|nr:Uncharacterised protein [Mycobacterium tuberculosis]CKP63432.1 Uncharacterised protein [Mycobacterium tuberculosis]CKR59377.1 Uncharacterised protein [Mycobacterium tuberculosis]CKU48979.1 Uncharacterised protein [Mycobacterium tuberculosis]CKW89914.1 Uncharacterised protein [Mycobacterium tuberculosis]
MVGTFDLDDLGAQVAEQPAELAAGHDDAQIKNPQTFEWIAADPA